MTAIKRKPKTAPKPTFYMILGLPPSSSTAALQDRYKSIARVIHEDVPGTGDKAKFQELTEAWTNLKDDKRRANYDARLKMEGNQCLTCKGTGTRLKTLKFSRQEISLCIACDGTGQKK